MRVSVAGFAAAAGAAAAAAAAPLARDQPPKRTVPDFLSGLPPVKGGVVPSSTDCELLWR